MSEGILEKVNDGSTVSTSKQLESETGFSQVQIREGENTRYFQQRPSQEKILIKIKAEENPYEVRWKSYFKKRIDYLWIESLKSRRKLAILW
ncbi:hypothetical protein M8R50_17125 [Enterobacter bugandensis]|uniref:hypothetical protein n=1 Tax=Enterobacter bugandensis TaxID=881260 RepID=UPI0020757BA3|nr:hypothetical protein [Enterobacter bugandensis]MCM7239256.1 hypothetical protein [Enterobacter bugandensis]MCM7319046.1 hypothetical protein [Enterobacter bugandensis]MCM7354627.1 hypothetical protein [Enterobacter bugandensis]